MEQEKEKEVKKQESTIGCLERSFTALTVDDVYNIAKLVGSEVERLIDSFGKASVETLVPKIVKVLELLESFAARNYIQNTKEEELLRAFETLQLQQQRVRSAKEAEEGNKTDIRDWQQKEQKWYQKVEKLQNEVEKLQEEKQELLDRLQSSISKEDQTQRQEREVMLKLKEVVDKQRDELRAKVQETSRMSKEVEALQEQLDRFMKMNGELRHKQNMMQAQLKSTVERRADLETDLCEKQKELERLAKQLQQASNTNAAHNPNSSVPDLTDKMIIDLKDPNRPCFTKQEVRDMLYERNELKANLFLVQEELAYYQREILNDERCPGFLLKAVRSAIKKQRTVIKAKMLGIPEDECSSDEENGPLFEKRHTEDSDCTDSRPPESRIRTLFGFLSRSGSGRSQEPDSNSSAWEIITSDEQVPEDRTRLGPAQNT